MGCLAGTSLPHVFKERHMYIYKIYKKFDTGEKSTLEYVTCTGNETLKEIQGKAEARLDELKARSKDPDSIVMERRLVPGI